MKRDVVDVCMTVCLSQTGAVEISIYHHCKRLGTPRSQDRSVLFSSNSDRTTRIGYTLVDLIRLERRQQSATIRSNLKQVVSRDHDQ